MAAEDKQGAGLDFRLNDDGSRLTAVYTPDGPVVPIGFAWLKQVLDEQRKKTGYYIFENSPAELKRLYNGATGPFSLDIGELRHGSCSITMTPDIMSASLSIVLPCGGKPVSVDQVRQMLKDKLIKSGIIDSAIEEAVAAGSNISDVVIAVGRQPANGEDGQLISLIPEAKERVPTAEEDEIVDYREISDIISVKQGTPLMRRIPPTNGTPGEDVMGNALAVENGKDIQFAPELSGVVLDQKDSDLLLAAVAGMPVLVANGVTVETVINVKNVDLSTGNLHFDGSVEVKGDVKEGMEIKVVGNLTVGGVVEAARIECGGDILVKGGIICHGDSRVKIGETGTEHVYVKSGGSISALFVENARLIADNEILIKELAMQSEMTAGVHIIIGEEGARKGHLIGGLCRAGLMIRAIVAGSRAGVQTRIEVGVDPKIAEQLEMVNKLIAAKDKDMQEVEKDLIYCREHPDRVDSERLKELRESYEHLQSGFAILEKKKGNLLKMLEPHPEAYVAVDRDIFYGVTVKIGDRQCHVEDDQFAGTFRRVEDEVVFLPRV